MKNRAETEAAGHAVERAIGFLSKSRNQEGLWSDFRLLYGSDEYVTAYVGALLAGTGRASAMALSREVWQPFGSRNIFTRDGGWAYNRTLPEDADSTAWGIKFAYNLGLKEKLRTTIAEKFLRRHITYDGGIASYTAETAFRAVLDKEPHKDMTGWLNAHPCVTAAAAVIPSFNRELLPYLLQHQLANGGWGAYWTSDTVFTASFAIEALKFGNYPEHQKAVDNGLNWIMGKFSDQPFLRNYHFPNGSPWATALAIRALVLAGSRPVQQSKMTEAVKWLLEQQKADGSWESSATMLMPAPMVRETCNNGDFTDDETRNRIPLYPDHKSLYTTATVIDALSLFYKKTHFNH